MTTDVQRAGNTPRERLRGVPTRALVQVALPLLVGGLVYIAWRPTSLLMFDWFQALGLGGLVDAFRQGAAPVRPHVPGWMIYSLPNALWAYACGATFARIWSDAPARQRYAVWTLLAATVASTELSQYAGVLPGTFDWFDLSTVCAAMCLTLPLFLDTTFGANS